MCYHPIKLRNGQDVPCGKCEECYSQRRNEWSVRLQLHTMDYAQMPLFVTLTYAPEYYSGGLRKKDLQNFVKRIRDKYDLYNSNFSFFACGEYGDIHQRGHYHILLFGMPFYEKFHPINEFQELNRVIESDWKMGQCFACRADWSGVHYVTKYVLKYMEKDWSSDQERPFTLCSKGIGKGFFESDQFKSLFGSLSLDRYRAALGVCPELDNSSPAALKRTSEMILHNLKSFCELPKITLPSGKRVPLPRYYKKKIYGSWEHWSFDPFSYYRYVSKMNQYANDVLNGIYTKNDRAVIKQEQFKKRGFGRGHFVKPSNNFQL